MRLDSQQTDRAIGVLLASAAGDALGVPYEFGMRPLEGEPEQLGGGLGRLAPGQWSDDTEMACVIAGVAATGADLRTGAALDAIADGFLRWYADNPPDIGAQTRQVLRASTPGGGSAARMAAVANALHEKTGKTAGNGSLMRTGPVALAHLGDTVALLQAARAISDLTHADPMAGDACVLWCLAIDYAVRTGELDLRRGLSHVDPAWVVLLDAAEVGEPSSFAANGWVVSALQASWSALTHTASLGEALIAAVGAGNDTDTVAAITGALGGALYGSSAVPFAWRRRLHGWPGLRAHELASLAVLTLNGGQPDDQGWPTGELLASYEGAATGVIPHPDDAGVLLGAVGALRPGVAEAVLSLCRLGSSQIPLEGLPAEDHVEVRLIDQEGANLDAAAVMKDAAEAVRVLRSEGKTVLLHCVYAETRTPLVAAAYGALITGSSNSEALTRVLAVLPSARPRASLRAVLEASG
jgi:ADP-ribosyl-[dinitrogen reductase] hydrolase